MSIQGLQLIYRLRTTIRLLIDYRAGVDSFNIYCSKTNIGAYELINNVINKASKVPATRGKIVFEFHTDSLINWDDDTVNYIKLAPVVGVIEGALEGPVLIPTRIENILPKEFAVMYGLNSTLQKFIPVSVDTTGKIITTV